MVLLPLILILVSSVLAVEVDDFLYVILSQSNVYHAVKSEQLRSNLTKQSAVLGQSSLDIYLLHERWPQPGAWTILPLMNSITQSYGEKKAVMFLGEDTSLNLEQLILALQTYDFNQEYFLGRALHDSEPTIIHHFAHAGHGEDIFFYPDFSAGFLLTMPLVTRLSAQLTSRKSKTDFNIDAKYELAKFIWDDGKGVPLSAVSFLCAGEPSAGGVTCATHSESHLPHCGKPISDDNLFVAVKTCKKFHTDRVPIVKATWGQEIQPDHIEFYSEEFDPDIPTVDLGVPNTERGHCGKLMAILERFNSHATLQQHDWLLVADDDTIISLGRLRQVLACYDGEEPVALGERYGYGQLHPNGYDYITGGGGMVLSQMAVRLLVDSGLCRCSSDEAPDDMTLGMCLKRLSIPVTHSPLFHQAGPAAYAADYLHYQTPVSFHKHWNCDPYKVYEEWLSPANTLQRVSKHEEL